MNSALRQIAEHKSLLESLRTGLVQSADLTRMLHMQAIQRAADETLKAVRHNLQFIDTGAIQRAAEEALRAIRPPDLSATLRDLAKAQDLQAIWQQLDGFAPLRVSVPEYLAHTGLTGINLAEQLTELARTMAAQNRLVLDAAMASALQSALEDRFAAAKPGESGADDLLAATLAATHKAAVDLGSKFDWKTWLPIVLALLLFLVQRNESQQSETRLLAANDSLRAEVARQDSQVAGLLRGIGKAATVDHATFLRDRPWAGSTIRQCLSEGTPVTILQRRRKWSFVMISINNASPTSTGFGWALNKYLRPE